MNKVIEDLKWLYKMLDIGGKTPEFYEAQKDIILQAIVVLNKQTEKQIRADAIDEFRDTLKCLISMDDCIVDKVAKQIKEQNNEGNTQTENRAQN